MNKKIVTSVAAMILVIVIVIVIVVVRKGYGAPDIMKWYDYTDIFFLFMAAFCRLASVLLGRANPYVGRRLNLIALGSLVLALVCGGLLWFKFASF